MSELKDELFELFDSYLEEVTDRSEEQRRESAKRLADNATRSALNEAEKEYDVSDLSVGQRWVTLKNATEYQWIRSMHEAGNSEEQIIETICNTLGGDEEAAKILMDVALDNRPVSHIVEKLAQYDES